MCFVNVGGGKKIGCLCRWWGNYGGLLSVVERNGGGVEFVCCFFIDGVGGVFGNVSLGIGYVGNVRYLWS